MPERLSADQIAEGMRAIPLWDVVDDRIVRQFEFEDFVAALGFIAQVGALTEKADHHPEIVNVYNRVKISLWTHTEDGITELDLRLAEAINARQPT